jgi:hypothetical protein
MPSIKTSALRKTSLAGLLLCLSICLAPLPCRAQQAGANPARTAGADVVAASAVDGGALVRRIKTVDSPAFRAYLYARVAAWLWQVGQTAGSDPSLRLAAVEAASAGVVDLHQHERRVPPVPAGRFYAGFLNLLRQHNPEEAERLRREYPLQVNLNVTDEDRAARAFAEALKKLNDPATAAPGLEEVTRLVASGRVPIRVLHGEVLRLDDAKSPALPPVLSALLALEERAPGSVPVQNMFFLSHVFLRETAPAELRQRFLAAAVKATEPGAPALAAGQTAAAQAAQLLRTIMPAVQKSNPGLYSVASAQLAALAPAAPAEDPVYSRIRNSLDPLAETLSEAKAASNVALKRELLRSAARLAKEQGKLRQAADLIVSSDEARPAQPAAPSVRNYSARDEFLQEVVREALKLKDVEAAEYAAAKSEQQVNRALALQQIAGHFVKSKDAVAAAERLEEAAKALAAAPEGKERAIAYLGLASDFAELDAGRARSVAREAVRAANQIERPREDDGGRFDWSLFPVADAVAKTFRQLARHDRVSALGLADTFQAQEFRIAAAVGVHSVPAK